MAAARHLALLAVVSLFGVSCGESANEQIVVLMDTDYSVPTEVDQIRARVFRVVEAESGADETETWSEVFSVSNDTPTPDGAFPLPSTFGVLPSSGAGAGEEVAIELQALATGSGRVLVSRRVRTGFVPGEARLVRILLYRACEGIVCDVGQSCGCSGFEACQAPACIDNDIPRNQLEPIPDPGSLPPNSEFPRVDGGTLDAGTEPDATVGDGGIVCDPPLTTCGVNCVDTQADPRFCGDCATACPSGNVCDDGVCRDPGDCRLTGVVCTGFTYCDQTTGVCVPGCDRNEQCLQQNEICETSLNVCVCDEGFHLCSGVCLSDLDVQSCGSSCEPCPAPSNAVPICELGECDFVCDEFFDRCGDACCRTGCPPGQALLDGVCAGTHLRVVAEQGNVGRYTSVALNAAGTPEISYYAVTGRDLLHAIFRPDDGWAVEAVERSRSVGKHASLAFDPAGIARVAYWDESNGRLRFATRQADGSWTPEVVDNNEDVGEYASLAFDRAGVAHIAYYNRDDGNLKVAVRAFGGLWLRQTIASEGNVGRYASLAFSPAGVAHISYYQVGDRDLMLAISTGEGSWRSVVVDSEGNVGRYTSLAFDAGGRAHISYYDELGEDLRYATTAGEGAWRLETVDSEGDVGRYTSLAIGPDGRPRISYYDDSAGDLKYAVRLSDGRWVVQRVDTEGDVGQYTSIEVDGLGQAHIGYYDSSNGDLKYALIAAPP